MNRRRSNSIDKLAAYKENLEAQRGNQLRHDAKIERMIENLPVRSKKLKSKKIDKVKSNRNPEAIDTFDIATHILGKESERMQLRQQ